MAELCDPDGYRLRLWDETWMKEKAWGVFHPGAGRDRPVADRYSDPSPMMGEGWEGVIVPPSKRP